MGVTHLISNSFRRGRFQLTGLSVIDDSTQFLITI